MTKPFHTDHSGDAGFVFQSKRTGSTVYYAEEQGCDPDGGRYVIICSHGRLVNVTSKRAAQWVACNPYDLCPACTKGDYTERSLTPDEERQ